MSCDLLHDALETREIFEGNHPVSHFYTGALFKAFRALITDAEDTEVISASPAFKLLRAIWRVVKQTGSVPNRNRDRGTVLFAKN